MASATSLVGALGARFPDSKVLFDDTFDEPGNLHGWRPLLSNKTWVGGLGWRDGHMVIYTEDQTDSTSAGPAGEGAALKRITHWPGRSKKYCLEVWWAVSTRWLIDNTRIRAAEFGFDECDDAGNRNLYLYRHAFVNETSGLSLNDWLAFTGTGVSPVISSLYGSPSPAYPVLPPNENKRNLIYTKAVIDLAAGCYDGLQINDAGYGSLAAGGGDASLRSILPQTSTLASFEGGINAYLQLRNRTNAAATACQMYVRRVRASVL